MAKKVRLYTRRMMKRYRDLKEEARQEQLAVELDLRKSLGRTDKKVNEALRGILDQ